MAIASFHLFSIPHAFDIGHHYKAVADQQEMHEMKAGQNADDEKKSITGAFTLTALWAMAVLLLTAESKSTGYSRRRQRKKALYWPNFINRLISANFMFNITRLCNENMRRLLNMLFILRMVILGLFSFTALNLFVWQGIEVIHAVTDLFTNHES